MENVNAFNNELSGLYETKPPISKAKMGAITKAAMRAIKFYKHVVQSVEKFILKCKPEYKIPGLYVIDSIVRQSRHQYGPDKDVFAPRFARNMTDTFTNLFRSATEEDKSRIVRVLNLWQKNNVFAPEVIQPIFDLADPEHPIYQQSGGVVLNLSDISSSANGLNISGYDFNLPGHSGIGGPQDDKTAGGIPDLSSNNLKQLLNDPNVLRQLQTLQNLQKFKQHEEVHKQQELHVQNSSTAQPPILNDSCLHSSKDVEFVSEQQPIEVINLDGNDSRSPSPERERQHKRRRNDSRSRSRSRDRGGRDRDRGRRRGGSSRSRSRSRSPRASRRRSSRERDRMDRMTRDKERDREHDRERRKKGLPDIKKEHLSVCSTTLWVGHLSKLVYQEELSDTFGEYGDIVSIDQIVPRGCAFIVMNRRQDAYKAMQSLKNHKLQGRAITISWAAGKGVKSKEWKDFWDLELGVTYIPWNKLDNNTDFDSLEEGGMLDEDTMPGWLREKLKAKKSEKNVHGTSDVSASKASASLLFNVDITQPPPNAPPPGMVGMLPGQFPIAPPLGAPPRMLGPMPPVAPTIQGIAMPPALVPGIPPPPHGMLMNPNIMPPAFAVGAPPPMGPPLTQYPPPGAVAPTMNVPPPLTVAGASTVNTEVGPNAMNSANEDQMDIEMEIDDAAGPIQPMKQQQQHAPNFNQPPPLLPDSGAAAPDASLRFNNPNDNELVDGNQCWQENGSNNAFNEMRGHITPDFANDFVGRTQHGITPNQQQQQQVQQLQNNGEFYQGNNIGPSRFNQPTNLLQMRIQPPVGFNQMGQSGQLGMTNPMGPAMAGGPMGAGAPPGASNHTPFGRNQGNLGGRQQGFYNARNPFNDGQRSGRGNRGAGFGGRPYHIWSDEEVDDNPGFQKQRRPGGGNRFRDGSEDRFARGGGGGGGRGGARGPGGNFSRDRSRDNNNERDRDRNRDSAFGAKASEDKRRTSASSGDDRNSKNSHNKQAAAVKESTVEDTEEDWDLELKEYDDKPKPDGKCKENISIEMQTKTNNVEMTSKNENQDDSATATEVSENLAPANASTTTNVVKNASPPAPNTPLYDELPAPTESAACDQSIEEAKEESKNLIEEPSTQTDANAAEAAEAVYTN